MKKSSGFSAMMVTQDVCVAFGSAPVAGLLIFPVLRSSISCSRFYWERPRPELGEFSEILGDGREQELVPGAIRSGKRTFVQVTGNRRTSSPPVG